MITEILNNPIEPHQPSGKFSLSSIGSCWRRKYMELKGLYKETYDEKTFRTFSVGDFWHGKLVAGLTSKGPANGFHVAAAEVNIRNNKYISGRCDLLLSHASAKKLYVVDFKSCGNWTFRKVLDGDVAQNYKDQVLLYMYFFHIHQGYLLFVNKSNSELAEVEVKYDEERAVKLIDQIKLFFTNYVEKDIEPLRCTGGDFGCQCCWPKEFKNKPTKEQADSILEAQAKHPDLFNTIAPTAVPEPLQSKITKNPPVTISRWEKVI